MHIVQVSDFQSGIINILFQLSTLHTQKMFQIFCIDNMCSEIFND